ncbi:MULTISPECIES: tetratricopeptide repeat protein [unclassified Novosphingobium]|uniref:tetratricopeptide repeat protein n=1 Tax=unclassified Novosphingobium TaxID=2644732 RepID=UPI0025F6B1AA|nr:MULTISPECIES: tetratricopeptide repeat protein [unclassified Novosphingobium]
MRYAPVAVALSLVVAMTGSMGSAKGTVENPRAATLVKDGRASLAKGDVGAATDNFEAALAIDPGSAAPLIGLAEAARRDGLQGKAIRYYRQALDRDPNNVVAISGEGGAMVEKGALEKARRNLTRLEGLCGKGCTETADLAAAIARGPAPRVVSAEAVKPDPKIETN